MTVLWLLALLAIVVVVVLCLGLLLVAVALLVAQRLHRPEVNLWPPF